MKKTLGTIGSVLALTFLLGAGCGKTPEAAQPQAKPAEEQPAVETAPADKPAETTAAPVTEFKLTAEAKGYATVQFNWEVPEDLAKTAAAYRIVNGEEENPTWPTEYYFQRGPTYREKLWSNLPTGRQHFRVCIVDHNECTVYSNDVGVDVK